MRLFPQTRVNSESLFVGYNTILARELLEGTDATYRGGAWLHVDVQGTEKYTLDP